MDEETLKYTIEKLGDKAMLIGCADAAYILTTLYAAMDSGITDSLAIWVKKFNDVVQEEDENFNTKKLN